MYDDSFTAVMAFMVFYFIFLAGWWLVCAIMGHALLSKKGYRHIGLYILAWVPLLNWISIFLFVGLPDALLNRKIDYLLRQMAASGMIQAPLAPQPQMPAQPQPAGPQPAYQAPQNADAQQPPFQPTWQPPQSQQAQTPVNPENLFGPGAGQNNSGQNSQS